MRAAFLVATLMVCAAAGAVADTVETAPVPLPRPDTPSLRLPPADPAPAARDSCPSLEAMIGQMIVLGFPGDDPGEAWTRRIGTMLADGRIGGVILYGDNVVSHRQLSRLTAYLQDQADALPAFIATDQEGGYIQRLTRAKGFRETPSARRVGRLEPEEARRLYLATAEGLAEAGINVNFGPVVDLNVNPRSPAIGRLARSYGRDPEQVVVYAREFIDAHRQSGVLTAAKHFPGHGSAARDSHRMPVDISRTWQSAELEPYRALIGADVPDMIMVGHLIHPRFSDGDRPASLSRRAIAGRLREDLGFGGLVVTDDLGMSAISRRYRLAEAAALAVAAGADLMIVANHDDADGAAPDRIIAAVAQAVANGWIDRAAIAASYGRIVAAKRRLAGPLPPLPAPKPDADEVY